jgi:hypothetical protein
MGMPASWSYPRIVTVPRAWSMTSDVYVGRKVAVTGPAAVLEAPDTQALDVSERGWRDTRLSRNLRQGHRTALARTDRRGRPAAPGSRVRRVMV